jgi:hypothetical protein
MNLKYLFKIKFTFIPVKSPFIHYYYHPYQLIRLFCP